MYLKQLYQHNKILCAAKKLFALAQLINNIRQDIAISPIYSYGMYSSRIMPADFYNDPEIFVNGKQLKAQDFSPPQWDNITLPVTQFYAQESWNLHQWQQDIHRLLPFTDSAKFVNNISEKQFKAWYATHLQTILKRKIESVSIVFTNYHFTGSAFTKANK